MTVIAVGPAFGCPHGRLDRNSCEDCSLVRATEAGYRPPDRPPVPELVPVELAEHDLLIDRGDGTATLVCTGDPIPAHLADRPRTPVGGTRATETSAGATPKRRGST